MKHVAPPNNYTIVKELDPVVQKVRENFDPDEAFWIADFNKTRNALKVWKTHLPNIIPHYAVKCCNEPNLLRFLAENGLSYDCASKREIQDILALGVTPDRIVFAHPLKSEDALKYAKEVGVKRLVYDTEEELRKILKHYPEADVFLRVKPKFSNAKIQLSKKFGASPCDVSHLLKVTAELGAKFIGFGFHVGSLCDDVTTFKTALQYVSELKQEAEKLNLKVSFIDIGGGFLSPNVPSQHPFAEIAESINAAIKEYFEKDEIVFIAEPGRFFGNEYMDLVLPVTSTKIHVDEKGGKTQSVYIPDSIYESFNAIVYDHAEPHFEIFTKEGKETYHTTLWGQTCDSADIIYEDMVFPKLAIGDVLVVRDFSAYTYSPTSFFNGFFHKPVHILNEKEEK
jgi:ornithine decarboxylase